MTARSEEYKSERIKQLEGLLGECEDAFDDMIEDGLDLQGVEHDFKIGIIELAKKIKAARGSNDSKT